MPKHDPDVQRYPLSLFSLGFRPFFLAAAVLAVALMVLWLAIYLFGLDAPAYYDPTVWHGHEMIFGYTVAVVAGFLLTAVRNWTGVQTATGPLLWSLVALWVSGRLAPFVASFTPYWLPAALDLSFLPALAIAVLVPVHRARRGKNYQFGLLLLALCVANALTHPLFGIDGQWQSRGLWLGVDLISVIIVVMGGRVIPFFIERAVQGARVLQWRTLDAAAIGSALLLVVFDLLTVNTLVVGTVAVLAGAMNIARLMGWHVRGLWDEPLLWVLYVGYAWLAGGFLLKALATFDLISPFIALHAVTAGAIGTLTLGMMARVTLGHTGRRMQAPRGIPLAFFLINLAALFRVAGLALFPGLYLHWVGAAGLLWIVAFSIFTYRYAPMLVQRRVDGLPG